MDRDALRMTSEKGGAGLKGQSLEGSTKPKVGVKAASLVPPHLTERQQLALLLKQTRTESLPVQSEESDSDQSDVSSSSSSGGNNRKKRRAGFGGGEKRHKKIDDQKAESNRKEDSKTEEKEGGSEDEGAPSGGFTHSARLPPPIPMPRGMGKRTRVRQRRTGAGDLRPHEGSGSGEDDDDPLPVRRPEEYSSWPPAKQAAWNNLATDANAFYEKYAPPGHELDLGEWTAEEQSRFLQVLKDHPVEDDQWGLFSMHFPNRNGMQCRQLHAKLVKSGAIGTDGEMRTERETRTVSQPSEAPSKSAVAHPSPRVIEQSSHTEKEASKGKENKSQEKEEKPRSSKVLDVANLEKGAKLGEKDTTESARPLEKASAEGSLHARKPEIEAGRKEGATNEKEHAPSIQRTVATPEKKGGTAEVAAETKHESKKDVLGETRREIPTKEQEHGVDSSPERKDSKQDTGAETKKELASKEQSKPPPEVLIQKERASRTGEGVSTEPEKREAQSNEQVIHLKDGDAAKKALENAPGVTIGKPSTAGDEASKPSTAFVRRQLAPNITIKAPAVVAPAVALALPAIEKTDSAPKQIRMANGKFGPSVQQNAKKPEEGSGPITLFKMVNGEKLSLTIRKREGEEPAKKRKKGGSETEADLPKGLTVVLGGKTVHKRKRMSDSARAGSPARERAKEVEDSDATVKTTKKVRIRHPAEEPEEKKRSRGGASALKPRALGFPPRLASNPSTPHSTTEAPDVQTGGMAGRVSSRELQQLMPASSPAYSPLFSLASARRRDREVLMGPERFRRGSEEGTPLATGKLLNACKLLTVLDKRDAKWHASAGGGWKEPAEEPPLSQEEPAQGSRGNEPKLEEPQITPPEAHLDEANVERGLISTEKEPPENTELRPEEAAEPSKQGADLSEEQKQSETTGERDLEPGGGPLSREEAAPPVEEGLSKLPEEIRRRRDALFAERMKLQKRWLYEYEILESGFEQLYEQAGEDEAGEEGKGDALVQTPFSHTLRPCRGQPEAANSFLRGGESSQPPTPQAFTKSYVELLFERSREDLLQRYKMEADALDTWHKWLGESSGPLMHAARHALEQMPLDPRQLIGT